MAKKWMQKVDDDGSLRRALGVDEGQDIEDVSDSDIKDAIQNHGTDFERKLIAYANMVGANGDKSEKNRILKIVRNTKNAEAQEESTQIDEARRIGNVTLNKLIKRAKKASSDIPTGKKKMNELEKYDKELYRKLYKANNLIERLKGWEKKVPTLKDMDDKGRTSAKKSLQKIGDELEKLSKEVNLSQVDKAINQAQKGVEQKQRKKETKQKESRRGMWENKVRTYLKTINEAIDKEDVRDAAYDFAVQIYGDDVDSDTVEEMVNKAMKKAKKDGAKTTKEAIGILQKMYRHE